jgi:hypothetical protein
MKSFLISIFLLSFLYSTILNAQDIKAKLSGHQTDNGFTVVDDNEKALLKVTGEGNIGVNTDNPSALFHVFGGPSNLANGKPIKIIAQDGTEIGGYVLLQGGMGGSNYAGDGARIIVGGGDLSTDAGGGDINILSGDGPDRGGDINIETSSHFQFPGNNKPSGTESQVKVGDINIHTGGSNLQGGNIRIYTGPDNAGGSGIDIFTQGEENAFISLTTGGFGNLTLTAGSNGDVIINPETGSFIVNGSGTYTGSWTLASDRRYKKNVEPIKNSLDQVTQLDPVKYEWKREEYPEKNFHDGKQVGLIAQDVEKILPNVVSTDSNGYKSIDYIKINLYLIEAIKEQQKSIEYLRNEVDELKSKLRDEVSLNTPSDN